jgi:hypothetical protein
MFFKKWVKQDDDPPKRKIPHSPFRIPQSNVPSTIALSREAKETIV